MPENFLSEEGLRRVELWLARPSMLLDMRRPLPSNYEALLAPNGDDLKALVDEVRWHRQQRSQPSEEGFFEQPQRPGRIGG